MRNIPSLVLYFQTLAIIIEYFINYQLQNSFLIFVILDFERIRSAKCQPTIFYNTTFYTIIQQRYHIIIIILFTLRY